jgi:hypothetical protein
MLLWLSRTVWKDTDLLFQLNDVEGADNKPPTNSKAERTARIVTLLVSLLGSVFLYASCRAILFHFCFIFLLSHPLFFSSYLYSCLFSSCFSQIKSCRNARVSFR